MMAHAPIFPRPLVFTNGCFDLLHAGHVDNLTRARAQGAYLVVAINSDDSVRALKGPSRPIMPQGHRVAMLSALRCVDLVLVFHEPTPIKLILECRPDVLVKGSDYDPAAVVDRRAGGQDVAAAPLHIVFRPDADGLDRALRPDHMLHGGNEFLRQPPVRNDHEPDHA